MHIIYGAMVIGAVVLSAMLLDIQNALGVAALVVVVLMLHVANGTR